jgi:acetyl esterase/lipase
VASILVCVFSRSLPAFLWLLCAFPSFSRAQTAPAGTLPQAIPLYSGAVPGALGDSESDKPRLYPMLPAKPSTSAAVLVIPGGGYQFVAMGYEGFQIGEWLRAQGIPAFVLDYRVAPYHYPVEIEDGRRAMRLLRARAAEWRIDPNRIGVWGSSAGGHLASSLGTHCDAAPQAGADPVDALSCKPDFMVLAYPVISMEPSITHQGSLENLLGAKPDPSLVREYSNELEVTPSTPPTFLFATERDPVVPVQNSVSFYNAMLRDHVPGELHVFDYANHGCGLCGSIPLLSVWPALVRQWLIEHKWLPQDAPPSPSPAPNGPGWPPGLTGPGMPKTPR